MSARLTKRTVDAFEWRAGGPSQQFLWDATLPGFGVYALSSGRKTFVAQFRSGRKTRRVTVGPYGVLTVEQARDKARDILATVTLEGDYQPMKPVEAERALSDVAGEFFTHANAVMKPKTSYNYRLAITKHFLPALGAKPLASITTADLTKIHLAMASTPYSANRAVDAFNSLWVYAASVGAADKDANPAPGVRRYQESARERFLTPDEMKRVGAALRTAAAETQIDPTTFTILRLLLMTGCRLREIMEAKWEWIDFERGFLNLPDPGSKTGKRPVVLSAVALALFDAQPRIAGNPYVFPGKKEGKPKSDIWGAWNKIRAAAGIEDVRIHDLRHSNASVGVGAGMSLPIVGKLLGHRKPQTTQRYAHLADDPVRAASTQIGEIITDALDEH